MNLSDYDLQELKKDDLITISGGFLPLAVILVIDGVMLACSAIALGMQKALDESQK